MRREACKSVGWAKRSVPTVFEVADRLWARRDAPLPTLRSQDEGRELSGTATRDATSAIAFITAFLTPGSYSMWPASSTMRISASGQRAASACEVEGGHN